MDIPDKIPSFTLKVVVQETGAKAHTLRSWERRYGLPQPQRTDSGYRMYSQRDIDTVKWLMERLDEGMTIGRAAKIWFDLEESGVDPLQDTAVAPERDESIVDEDERAALAGIRQQWIDSCLRFDRATAERVLSRAFAIYPVKTVCFQVLVQGVVAVGDLWFENKATEQQEHFATALTIQRLNSLLAAAPAPNRAGRILVAAPPYEEHIIGLLLFALLLRYRGWDVVYLGANLPLTQLETTVNTIVPDLVVMGAQQLQTAASLSSVAKLLNQKGITVAFAGRIFHMIPALRDRVQGHFLGDQFDEAVSMVNRLMTTNPRRPRPPSLSSAYQQALEAYQAKRPLIELGALRQLLEDGIPYEEHLASTNTRMSESIVAALNLGNMHYIDYEIELNRALMANYGIPMAWQGQYFDAYFRSARQQLGEEGTPVVNWLQKIRTVYQAS